VRRRACGERIYRLLLALYPGRFRRAFGAELLAFQRQRLRDARRRDPGSGALLFWLAAYRDLLASAAAERLDAVRPGRERHRFGGRSRRASMNLRDTFSREIGHAARALWRRPLYTGAALATLALGIGGSAFFFGLIDAILLRPLPFDRAGELVSVWNRYGAGRASSSPPDYMDRRNATTLAAIAASDQRSMAFQAEGEPRQVQVARVTSGYFDLLGVRPQMGHVVFPPEDGNDPGRLAVVGHRLWREELGSDPAAIGRTVRLDGVAYQVQAVAPPGMDLPRGADLWAPLVFAPNQLADAYRGNERLDVVARLAPGVTIDEARVEMESIAATVLERVPGRADFLRRAEWGADVTSLQQDLFGASGPALRLLMGAMLTLLLIACANVAHLQLAAATSRERELRLRACLGAGRGRLFRETLAESALLALAGGGAGLALAWAGLRLAPRFVPSSVPRIEDVALDVRVVLFALALTSVVALALAALPGLRATRLAGTLGDRSVSGPHSKARARGVLVVHEVALAILLLVSAGLFLRSFSRLAAIELGFGLDDRVAFRVTLPSGQFDDREARRIFASSLLERLRAWPEVGSAAYADRLPLDGRVWTGTFYPEGFAAAEGEGTPGGDLHVVSDAYFRTLGVDVLEGREFQPSDAPRGQRVVVVDESTARRLWPQGALGRRLGFSAEAAAEDLWTVVGVVRPVRQNELDESPAMQLYFPAAQWPERDLTFVLRGRLAVPAVLPRVREELRTLAPGLPAYQPRTLSSLYRDAVALPRLQALFLAGFAGLALLLAAIGVHGVLSLAVSGRRAEIGVRMALGASGGGILGMILRQGVVLVASGAALGGAAAWAVARWLESAAYGVEAADGKVFGAAAALLVVSAAAAALAPAWRAARVDPVTALRAE
jgi:predicted permease